MRRRPRERVGGSTSRLLDRIVAIACRDPVREAQRAVQPTREKAKEETVTKTFSMDTTADPLSLLARARRVARENGATLVGGKESGRFSHDMVRGEYRVVGRKVTVTITEKHWLVPWPVVESRLRQLLR